MADFINTVDVLGDAVVTDSIIDKSITEFKDNNIRAVGTNAFYNCSSLTTVSFPACTSVGSLAFYNCSSLTTVSFPACTSVGNYAFYCCSSLTTVSFPACTSVASFAFYKCSSLSQANFPACRNIGGSAFASCSSLTTVSFPACTRISAYAFYNCSSLSALVLAGSVRCSLDNSATFSGTPIASGTGYVYVPASLVASYQEYGRWSYFSTRISAIEDSEFYEE